MDEAVTGGRPPCDRIASRPAAGGIRGLHGSCGQASGHLGDVSAGGPVPADKDRKAIMYQCRRSTPETLDNDNPDTFGNHPSRVCGRRTPECYVITGTSSGIVLSLPWMICVGATLGDEQESYSKRAGMA